MVVLQISICRIAAILFVCRFLNIKKNLPWVNTLLLTTVIALRIRGSFKQKGTVEDSLPFVRTMLLINCPGK